MGGVNMNRYEYENSQKNRKVKRTLKKSVRGLISRIMITVILFLLTLILVKENKEFKKLLIDKVYNESLQFTEAKKIYEKYFGSILSVDKIVPEEEAVFSEKLDYKKSNLYKDGVELEVSKEYLTPALESGIVVFMGEKEDYGTTIIIQQIDGVDVWYCNIEAKDIKMYDYVKKGALIGQVKSNKLYLVFQKEGKYLNYKEYI